MISVVVQFHMRMVRFSSRFSSTVNLETEPSHPVLFLELEPTNIEKTQPNP